MSDDSRRQRTPDQPDWLIEMDCDAQAPAPNSADERSGRLRHDPRAQLFFSLTWTIRYSTTTVSRATSAHLEREFGAACRDDTGRSSNALY